MADDPTPCAAAPTFAALGEDYAARVAPTPLPQPRFVHVNRALADELGIDTEAPWFLPAMAGNAPYPGHAPLSSVYAGHQFGVFVPQLGDGRAHLIASLPGGSAGRPPQELQLKGSGPTPWSRFADGRAVLRSSIREYLCSEAMHALGIPTTRALALVVSTQPVRRETIEPAAVVCRVAPSFVRFGHFEYFYYAGQHQRLAPLADHLIATQFPQYAGLDAPQRYRAWLAELVEATARLLAQWQAVGFCHGVMNTDNFSALGLTLDYGPFGFLDAFAADHVCNHSDDEGRYAYQRQPTIGQWNCSRLLQAALPLIDADPKAAVDIANGLLDAYAEVYAADVKRRWADKLGLRELRDGDATLINRYLTILDRSRADFTRSFRKLAALRSDTDAAADGIRDEIADLAAFDAWVADYRARLRSEHSDDAERAVRMNRVNPLYVLRNHLAQRAIERAEAGDDSEVARLHALLQRPFDEQPDGAAYAAEPPPEARHISVSCSS